MSSSSGNTSEYDGGLRYVDKDCYCGKVAHIRVTHSNLHGNQGRLYYVCRKVRNRCSFWSWCEPVAGDDCSSLAEPIGEASSDISVTKTSSSGKTSQYDGPRYEEEDCDRCGKVAHIRVWDSDSDEDANQGRLYYVCKGKHCFFSMWCEPIGSDCCVCCGKPIGEGCSDSNPSSPSDQS